MKSIGRTIFKIFVVLWLITVILYILDLIPYVVIWIMLGGELVGMIQMERERRKQTRKKDKS